MEKIKLVISMVIVGTLGLFTTNIALPSSAIACARSVLGTLFILCVMLILRKCPSFEAIKKNAVILLLSGGALGFNWILLFESYKHTTVAVGTLCYYMAPIFVILASPFVLKESLTVKKLLCTAGAVLGAVLISGVFTQGGGDLRGVAFGLCAAVLYASIVLLNKKLVGIDGLERTLCQLGISAVVMVIYTLSTERFTASDFDTKTVILLLVLGILHTGVVYMLFFSAIGKLPAQTSSVLSYVDPVTAVICSALFLMQPMEWYQIVGTVLILGCSLAGELLPQRKA